MYLNEALKEYYNPPQLKGDIGAIIMHSQLGPLVLISIVFGSILTLIRFLDGDDMWWWFIPDKKYINRPKYYH